MLEKYVGSSICVISPKFFGYENDISQELRLAGANVTLLNETVSSGLINKSFLRLGLNSLVRSSIEKYYTIELIDRANEFDVLFIINPETIDLSILERCKLINPDLKIVVYMWDSINNKPRAINLKPASDVFFTFDPKDASNYDISFLPLFYNKDYLNAPDNKSFKYLLSFIGTAHSQRYSIVNRIMRNNSNTFSFFYCPSIFVFLYKKYFKKELTGLSYSDVSTSSMTRSEILSFVFDSHAVVDVSHPDQVGLTMRTIEMLGAGKKLVTTNVNVKSYDFYHSNNIFVYDDDFNDETLSSFLKLPYIPISNELREKYSLRSWLNNILISKKTGHPYI